MDSPFHPHTKQAWLDAVSKELPEGKTIADLFLHTDVFDHDGFAWPGPQNEVTGTIPVKEWKIMARCPGNSACMSALENGAEALWCAPEAGESIEEFIQGIKFEFIHTLIDVSQFDESEKLKWHAALLEQTSNGYLSWMSQSPAADEYQLLEVSDTQKPTFLNLAATISQQWQDQQKGWVIVHHLGSDFYGEIAWARAIREVCGMLAKSKGIPKDILLLGQLETGHQDANQDLIRYSYMALSAVMGGYDFISGLPWGQGLDKYARLVQNIQLMMKHESKLHLFRDPMAGSYFIEDISKVLVDEALLYLQK
jgi:hypothetical protein